MLRHGLTAVSAAFLVAALAQIGCSGTQPGSGDRQQGPWLPPREDREGQVSIRSSTVAELDAWLAQETTVIGDVVEIEATRVPFASDLSIQATTETDGAGHRIVERTETTDPATGVVTITISNKSSVKTNLKLLPQVRSGGRQFVATDRILLRWIPSPSTEHPVTFTAVARGRVTLLESSPLRKVKGAEIVLRADVQRNGADYEFRPGETSRP
ncbi:MAG: hypothetical protein K8T90_00615 [Planctomycetes bacterium]|nr:hypothetical protein [Planctomycetota bacterium]